MLKSILGLEVTRNGYVETDTITRGHHYPGKCHIPYTPAWRRDCGLFDCRHENKHSIWFAQGQSLYAAINVQFIGDDKENKVMVLRLRVKGELLVITVEPCCCLPRQEERDRRAERWITPPQLQKKQHSWLISLLPWIEMVFNAVFGFSSTELGNNAVLNYHSFIKSHLIMFVMFIDFWHNL